MLSKTGDSVAAYFGWFSHFAGMDCRASSAKTREALGWDSKGPGLLDDMINGGYFA